MSSEPGLPASVQRFVDAARAQGLDPQPRMLDAAARTAQQAADALGIELGQIAKSIIFRRESDGAHVLVVTAGDRRVDTAKVATLVGAIGRADAAFVRERSGYAIGGVPPLGHALPPVVLLDESLQRFDVVWAAAGHPHAVFASSAQQLASASAARVANVVSV